jgi:ABC-type glycerol-3-phosphate transport system substrate-binding protein
MVQRFGDFIYKIPYTSYAEKTFRDAFIDGANVYLANDGVLGFPIMVDPMMLYYNKDIFSNEGLVSTPQYWDQLFGLSSKLTKKKDDGTILQSMIALGRYDNISHSKDILATLLLQSGNSIIESRGGGICGSSK